MYRSEDVREALRIAVQRGNDTAAWNSGMDGKQIVAEAEDLFDDLVPMEPDYEASSKVLEAWEGPSTANLRIATEIVDAALGIGGDDE